MDWPAADRDGFVISNGSYLNWTNSVNNAFYYRCLQIMANIATVIGRTNDAATYTARAAPGLYQLQCHLLEQRLAKLRGRRGRDPFLGPRQFLSARVRPGARPRNQTAVVNYLHSRIAANNGMPPSVYGAQYLLEALFQSGDADTALGLMTTNGSRSWMNMINLGSTLTTEAWNFTDKSNEDWNHAWGSAAGNLIQRFVLGLQPITAGCGQILIQPQLGQTLSYVQGIVPTIRGPVSISASNAPGQFQLLLNIPGNVTATVMLPTRAQRSSGAGGWQHRFRRGIQQLAYGDERRLRPARHLAEHEQRAFANDALQQLGRRLVRHQRCQRRYCRHDRRPGWRRREQLQ